MTLKPVSLKFPFPNKVANRKNGRVVGWLTVFSVVSMVSVASLSTFSSQQSIAQISQRTPLVRKEGSSQQVEQLKRQRLARSIAVLTRGIKPQAISHSNSPTNQESQPLNHSRNAQRTMGDYMEAISVVYAAIVPQRQPGKSAKQPSP